MGGGVAKLLKSDRRYFDLGTYELLSAQGGENERETATGWLTPWKPTCKQVKAGTYLVSHFPTFPSVPSGADKGHISLEILPGIVCYKKTGHSISSLI